jgi:hypothetical protein
MINIWGVCEFAEMTHDPLRKWDMRCSSFSPASAKKVEEIDVCCANCLYWLIADEHLEENGVYR